MVINSSNVVLTLSRAVPLALLTASTFFTFGLDRLWPLSLMAACFVIALWSYWILHERRSMGQKLRLEVHSIGPVLELSRVLISPGWIFCLIGYHLYRVTLVNDVEVVMLSRQNVFNISKRTIDVVEVNGCCFMDVTE